MSHGSPTITSTGVLADIVQWSTGLALWQQDALRRIIEHGELSTDDVGELVASCERDAGIVADATEPHPPDASSVCAPTDQKASVSLVEIAAIQNVNAICDQQTLRIGRDGLTVVFGYNGSGKSGYGRVLRRACRARHSENGPILHNVWKPAPNAPASAEITFAVDGNVQPVLQWIDGSKSDELLCRVSFFDSNCARVHVGQKNDIAFTPYGLDLLEKLAEVCVSVRDRIEAKKQIIISQQPVFISENPTRPATDVGILIRALNANTGADVINALAKLSDEEVRQLKSLPDELKRDPAKLAFEKRARAKRLGDLQTIVSDALRHVDDIALEKVLSVAKDRQEKQTAADLAAKASFDSEPLPNVGSAVWRRLWEAAREYSTTFAYPAQEFPLVTDSGRCVLCQQELSSEAASRLQRFEAFIQDTTAKQADAASRALDSLIRLIDEEARKIRGKHCRDLLQELELLTADAIPVVRRCLAGVLQRMRTVRQSYRSNDWNWSFAPLDSPQSLIQAVRTALRNEATELDGLSDPARRSQLEAELAGLEDRAWLGTVLQDVLNELARKKSLAKLDECLRACNTNKITRESKRFAQRFVTDALRSAFARELKQINEGVRRVEVELEAAEGRYGTPYYQVRLIGAKDADVPSVVSEGEHRCIALAGFLAELATDDGRSAIVFDDPVTSLDHLWRESFARRVVQEAVLRQVIVFTHDVAFLNSLQEDAIENGVPLHLRGVEASGSVCGVISDDLPWVAQSTKQRIDTLDQQIKSLRDEFAKNNDDGYAEKVAVFHSRLRATIERAIVDVFFVNIVQRHRDFVAINHRLIKKVSVVRESDWEDVRKLHKRCCSITEAHDRGELRSHHNAPAPDSIKKDVDTLSALVKDIRSRQSDAEKSC